MLIDCVATSRRDRSLDPDGDDAELGLLHAEHSRCVAELESFIADCSTVDCEDREASISSKTDGPLQCSRPYVR